jgi:hypothetical protein
MTRYAIVTQEISYQVPLSCTCSQKPTYRLEISVRVPDLETNDRTGADFERLKQIIHHNHLSGLPGMALTTERVVHAIWDLLVAQGVPDQLLYRIRFWETQHRYVEITHAERETDVFQGFEDTTHSEKE